MPDLLDDPARLAVLHGAMLRTEADVLLDACVAQAARLARAPIAMVSLVIRHIQLLRAHHGLPLELAVSCATSRSNSFCQIVVRDEAPLIVEDALRDERVPKELVEHYGIRAYAGVPVRVSGHAVGSLCVLDVVPRRFERRALDGLEQLAVDAAARLAALVEREAPLCSPATTERLVRIEQATRVLERALLALAPVIAAAPGARAARPARPGAPAPDAPQASPVSPADLRAAVGCWRDMGPIAEELCEDAAALARSAPCAAASEVVAEARALARCIVEIGPLVRLAEGLLDGTLGEAAAGKGTALVLRGAIGAYDAASAAARTIRGIVERARSAQGATGGGAAL
ncbi:GAF domain-containing protein [Sorangium cellulosum]|nr:GAF domain-containing protein [Sorangium cellulosum]